MEMLSCWASTNDIESTRECAVVAKNLHDCMRVAVSIINTCWLRGLKIFFDSHQCKNPTSQPLTTILQDSQDIYSNNNSILGLVICMLFTECITVCNSYAYFTNYVPYFHHTYIQFFSDPIL
jgi:hypothetical protein